MKFRKIIKNGSRSKSVVQKFNSDNMKEPVQEVVYAMPTLQALTYFYMQFIVGDFLWERYPKYIEGTLRSAKIKDVFYYDKLDGFLIRSSPYTGGEKWKFHTKPKKSVLPERKKHLVLKKVEVKNNDDTSREVNKCSGTIIAISDKTHTQSRGTKTEGTRAENVGRDKDQFNTVRNRVHSIRKRTRTRVVTGIAEREPEVKVVVECSRRPKLKRGSKKEH